MTKIKQIADVKSSWSTYAKTLVARSWSQNIHSLQKNWSGKIYTKKSKRLSRFLAQHDAEPLSALPMVSGLKASELISEAPLFSICFLPGKISNQFFCRILHTAPEPDLNPAIQKEPHISGRISGGYFLLRIEAAQI